MLNKILFVLLILICILNPLPLKALTISMTTKEFLSFEILDAQLTESTVTLSGWAFINDTQHFRNATDHSIQLEFISIQDTFIINTDLTNISMTSSNQDMSLSFCKENIYNTSSCNYYFENVGFQVTIPLDQFKKGIKYSTNIIVLANNSKKYLKTPLYYPIENPISIMKGDYQYSITSKLYDTNFRVIETPIYARKGPTKTGTIWKYGTNCSSTHANNLYFKFGSVFTNILERYMALNQTYYRVNATLDICMDLRRRIVEGTVLSPVWISGMFVEYSGSPLELNSVLINTPPTLIVQDIEILEGKQINLLDYAKSYDNEDGDLTNQIVILASNYLNRPGVYQATYYIEDKYGYFAKKTINITVLGVYNDPPMISAVDKTILQYSKFEYFDEVFATDKEDGDLSYKLKAINSIDTYILGNQNLCYSVSDSKGASTLKCITITVFNYSEYVKHFRFISKNNTFYKESIPNEWNLIYNQLQSLLLNDIAKEYANLEP